MSSYIIKIDAKTGMQFQDFEWQYDNLDPQKYSEVRFHLVNKQDKSLSLSWSVSLINFMDTLSPSCCIYSWMVSDKAEPYSLFLLELKTIFLMIFLVSKSHHMCIGNDNGGNNAMFANYNKTHLIKFANYLQHFKKLSVRSNIIWQYLLARAKQRESGQFDAFLHALIRLMVHIMCTT